MNTSSDYEESEEGFAKCRTLSSSAFEDVSSYELSQQVEPTTIKRVKIVPVRSTKSGDEIEEPLKLTVLFSPLTDVVPIYGDEGVGITIVKNGSQVTLQWMPFESAIGQSGVEYITLNQSLVWLPEYPMEFPFIVIYKGKRSTSSVMIEPGKRSPLRFVIPKAKEKVTVGDSVVFPGGSITWILATD